MNQITKQMEEFAERTAHSASQKTAGQLAKQAKEVGLDGPVRAKWKIEVTFSEKRTTHGPNLFGVQIWESGRRLNGGGDDLTFWCLSNDPDSQEGCGATITSDNIKGQVAFCPSCKRAVNAEMLTNMKVGRMTTKMLATEIEKMFRKLDSNADIYIKYHKTDIRYIAMERAKGPDTARRLKGMHIYPLKNILRDTANGASLHGRLVAFLTS